MKTKFMACDKIFNYLNYQLMSQSTESSVSASYSKPCSYLCTLLIDISPKHSKAVFKNVIEKFHHQIKGEVGGGGGGVFPLSLFLLEKQIACAENERLHFWTNLQIFCKEKVKLYKHIYICKTF